MLSDVNGIVSNETDQKTSILEEKLAGAAVQQSLSFAKKKRETKRDKDE